MGAVIQIEELRKTFQGQDVLDGIDLQIGSAERVALIGANGAGKTTLVRCLLGEYRYQGSLWIDGRSPRRERTQLLARAGFVPQLPPPLRMPVGVFLRFAAQICGERPESLEAMSARLGLEVGPIRRRPFVKLSGGQKQKLLIAVALGRETDLLLLDEPAANLDPPARRSFFELLRERAGRATMLISSHRLEDVSSLVERVVELDRGRVTLDEGGLANELSSSFRCRLEILETDPSLLRTLEEWGFEQPNGIDRWTAVIAGPDRLRFMGVISRYTRRLSTIEWIELDPGEG